MGLAQICLYLAYHIGGCLQPVTFHDCLFSCHVFRGHLHCHLFQYSIPFMANWYAIIQTYHVLLIHSPIDGHLLVSTFSLLKVMLTCRFVYKSGVNSEIFAGHVHNGVGWAYHVGCSHFSWVQNSPIALELSPSKWRENLYLESFFYSFQPTFFFFLRFYYQVLALAGEKQRERQWEGK